MPIRPSLTRRLAWIFSLTTCVLLGIHTLGALYFVFDTLRDELGLLLEHESTEFLIAVDDVDISRLEAAEVVHTMAESFDEPASAFRIRRATGEVLAVAGEAAFFDGAWTLVPEDERVPRDSQQWERLGTTRATTNGRLFLDFVFDGGAQRERLREYFRLAVIAFLVMAAFSGVAGWFVAVRGLHWLRDVASQSRRIDLPVGSTSIRLENPPEEVRELTTALNAMLARIDKRLSEMRTFTAGLAHELRSPLQNLIGETEVALMSERPREEYESLLRSNLDELQDLSSAVGNLVTYCRTNEPHQRVEQVFDAKEEVALILEGQARHIERSGIALELSASGDTSWIGDCESYRRVVRNLVDNATSWSPRSGTITIAVDGTDERLSLTVEDEGPGVAEALRDRMFDPFVSGRPREGRRGGYGLGLTICRTLVEQAGGTIRHEQRTGGGSRFVVELPRPRVAA